MGKRGECGWELREGDIKETKSGSARKSSVVNQRGIEQREGAEMLAADYYYLLFSGVWPVKELFIVF